MKYSSVKIRNQMWSVANKRIQESNANGLTAA